MSVETKLDENKRRIILECLLAAPQYSANEDVVRYGLERMGHYLSRAVVSGVVDWLEEAGLVNVKSINDDIRVVKLSARGQDIAEGRSRYTGVERPPAGR